ncbi:class I SAM-dependent methyltransferase [Viridibacillus sp. FSL R5-0477]|uniref:Methyltransferase type 11 n=1 Tax=Viridibacillus arenosi FSL R5-213 TaxID=1227360 RepID=W4EKV0_9BACL|nr:MULTISPECIES: class I SAM-dependent methyltransferase [Viridibacillus]ETT81200.1 methyltransferase type 11 [Viridibacillus arenosi FSL R5-213]OMC84141.1 SAM-dependent methyltransferase [Viridibacillus sp. FSL H8-0123]OMC88664.1 SAM-dependent methyltransferase [Viridibacillus sp. FSL H7-0596]OMC93297.1 SAM-dependent methyltransferase [Viridibacillus arenosi]
MENIKNYDDLKNMLDSLLREPEQFWDEFYSDREKRIPFFENKPDENLVSYFDRKLLNSGHALELGCGPGRNAIYLTEKGYKVDAVDLSVESLKWARDRMIEKNITINFINHNIFDLYIEDSKYDLVYDSGCFHHIAPHRRMDYIDLIKKSLKQNGYFAINCFIEDGPIGGSSISDWEVYRIKSLQGGLGFTEEKLRRVFQDFECIEVRNMRVAESNEPVFGIDGLLTAIFQKKC